MNEIQIITDEWIDIIILDEINNIAKRKTNNDSGKYIIHENELKIYWNLWGIENFFKYNDIYYHCNNNYFEIYVENSDWNDICIFNIDKKKVKRKYCTYEYGNYDFKNNILTIQWEKWGYEIFYPLKFGKYYSNSLFAKNVIDKTKKYIKNIAIVFPQFHEIPENNEFWGNGFTEWTLLKNVPRIVNGEVIKQPHDDIGYFNLKDYNHRKYMRILANHYNIYGFCYYHYWFKNKKVMYEPTELMLFDQEPNKPYMFCWANEQWTRRWDGGNNEILLSQEYGDHNANVEHFYYLLDFFKTKNYIKKFNKPIFIFYRIEENDIEDIRKIINLWNHLAIKEGFEGIYFMRFLGPFNNENNIENINGFVEFAPGFFSQKYFKDIYSEDENKIFINYDETIYLKKNNDIKQLVNNKIIECGYDHFKQLDENEKKFRTSKFFVYDGISLYKKMLDNKRIFKEQYRGISVNWNNTPRRNYENEEYDKYPHYYKNITPQLFAETYSKLLYKIDNDYNEHDDFLFISAWNEWNEQAILEPNNEDGYDYLNGLNKKYLEFYQFPKKNMNILNISHIGGGTSKYMDDLKNTFYEYNFIDFDIYENNINYDNIYLNIDIVHINSILFNNLKDNYIIFFDKYLHHCKKYITIHDYQWIFPDDPNISKYNFLNNIPKNIHIQNFKKLLSICDKIIFPSSNIYQNYQKYVDMTDNILNIHIVNHCDKIINHNFLVIPIIDEFINIAFIGNFVEYKGCDLFKKLSLYYENIKCHTFGSISENQIDYIKTNNDIIFHGAYKDNEIIDQLHKHKIHGIVHLSIFEESYCYALTNSINSGIPIFYINHGTFKERLINKEKYFCSEIDNIILCFENFIKYIILNENSYNYYKLNDNIQPSRWYLENYI